MPELIERLDAETLLRKIDHDAGEVSTEELLDELMDTENVTFEGARDILYGLLAAHKVVLTPTYKIRLP